MTTNKRLAAALGLLMLGLLITYGGHTRAEQVVLPHTVPVAMKLLSAQDFASRKLRGFVIGSAKAVAKQESFYSDLVATGSNLGRIFINLERCESCAQYEVKSNDLKNLDLIVRMGQKYGFYAVITFGLPRQDSRGELWRRSSLQESLIKTWTTVVARYRGNPAVAGYDILNEPVPPGLTFDHRQKVWLPYAAKLVQAIRSVDPEHTIIVEPAPDSTPMAFKNMRPLPFDNIVYSFHLYMPMEITHQGVSKEPSVSIPYPVGAESGVGVWDKSHMSELIEPVRQFSKKYNVPIYVGEFSCVRWAPNNSAIRYVKDALDIFEQEGWAWTYHEFRGWHGWDAEIGSPLREDAQRSSVAPIFVLLKQFLNRNRVEKSL